MTVDDVSHRAHIVRHSEPDFLFLCCSGGGSRGSDPLPDERGDEAAAAVQSQNPAARGAQQEELHAGGRAEEATAGQSGASGLPAK